VVYDCEGSEAGCWHHVNAWNPEEGVGSCDINLSAAGQLLTSFVFLIFLYTIHICTGWGQSWGIWGTEVLSRVQGQNLGGIWERSPTSRKARHKFCT